MKTAKLYRWNGELALSMECVELTTEVAVTLYRRYFGDVNGRLKPIFWEVKPGVWQESANGMIVHCD